MKFLFVGMIILLASFFVSSCGGSDQGKDGKKPDDRFSVKGDKYNEQVDRVVQKDDDCIIKVRTDEEFKKTKFDVWFTYKNYDGYLKNKDKAVYIWNGEEIGMGEDGIIELKKRIEALPEKTRILFFPFDLTYTADGSMGGKFVLTGYPFVWSGIDALIKKNKLILIYSAYTNDGKPVHGP